MLRYPDLMASYLGALVSIYLEPARQLQQEGHPQPDPAMNQLGPKPNELLAAALKLSYGL